MQALLCVGIIGYTAVSDAVDNAIIFSTLLISVLWLSWSLAVVIGTHQYGSLTDAEIKDCEAPDWNRLFTVWVVAAISCGCSLCKSVWYREALGHCM